MTVGVQRLQASALGLPSQGVNLPQGGSQLSCSQLAPVVGQYLGGGGGEPVSVVIGHEHLVYFPTSCPFSFFYFFIFYLFSSLFSFTYFYVVF